MVNYNSIRNFLPRNWIKVISIAHGVQRILPWGSRVPLPIDAEQIPFAVYSRDQEDNTDTHLNKLHTISSLQGISPEGFVVDLRSTESGDLFCANSSLSFFLSGGSIGPALGYRPRPAAGQNSLEYIASSYKNNLYVADFTYITDNEGWIDVRHFSKFSLTASATGEFSNTYEHPSSSILDFAGEIKVEYRNYRFEPTEGTLATMTIDGPRHEIISSTQPADISAIGWIRISIVSGNDGSCKFFGMLQ